MMALIIILAQRVPLDIMERGYDRGLEFFLHDHQKGKLSGIETLDTPAERRWAASGVERVVGDAGGGGRVVRKVHGEGIRLDSDAVRGRGRGSKKEDPLLDR
jgi:hypothetical protein